MAKGEAEDERDLIVFTEWCVRKSLVTSYKRAVKMRLYASVLVILAFNAGKPGG